MPSDTGEEKAGKTFNDLLLEAIDEGLSSLGESPRQAIYYHLEEDFHIAKPEIPQKLEAFTQAIEEVFGAGASPLKILLMKKIHDKIGGEFAWEDKRLAFLEYVTVVKQHFVERRGN